MTIRNQSILNFGIEKNFKDDDFYVSKSNKHIFEFLNKWPKWEKNFLNIYGEKFSGKTHLVNIFIYKIYTIRNKIYTINHHPFDSVSHSLLSDPNS